MSTTPDNGELTGSAAAASASGVPAATGTENAGTENAEGAGHSHGYSGDKTRLLARLSRIEGQVRGLARMIDEDKYCIDILTQISATTSGLENVALTLLEDHLAHCVVDAARAGSADEKVTEAADAIRRLVKS